jgi:hypothetical protein
VWDLADGFAIIALAVAQNPMTASNAKALDAICSRIEATALRLEKEELAQTLQAVRDKLQEMIP